MFDPIFGEITNYLIKGRTDLLEGEDAASKPITAETLLSLKPVALALGWIVEMCEQKRINPDAPVKLPQALQDIQAGGGGPIHYELLHGLSFDSVADHLPVVVEAARGHAAENVELNIRQHLKAIFRKTSLMVAYVSENRLNDPAAFAVAHMSIDVAAHFIAFMFKAIAFAEDRYGFEAWVESQIAPATDSFIPGDSLSEEDKEAIADMIEENEAGQNVENAFSICRHQIEETCRVVGIAPPDVQYTWRSMQSMRHPDRKYRPKADPHRARSWNVRTENYDNYTVAHGACICIAIQEDPEGMTKVFRRCEELHKKGV